ncbi:hypothetical protein B0H10DRAFT_2013798 [Mycena sp. CBHHK59/15]|nr:hypothetical protein B0H10DRAFT_2013798 [Mycena sp. CBHHK59/15]
MSSHLNHLPKRKQRQHPPVPEVNNVAPMKRVKRPRQAVWTSMWTREEMAAADVEDGLRSTAESEVDWELVLETLRRTAGLQALERFHNDDRFDREPPAPSWYGFREIDSRKEIRMEEPVVLREGQARKRMIQSPSPSPEPSGLPLAKETEPTSSPLRRIDFTKLDLSPCCPPRRERRETITRQRSAQVELNFETEMRTPWDANIQPDVDME